MKQKKRGKICFVIYIAGERNFFLFMKCLWSKKKKALRITTDLEGRERRGAVRDEDGEPGVNRQLHLSRLEAAAEDKYSTVASTVGPHLRIFLRGVP